MAAPPLGAGYAIAATSAAGSHWYSITATNKPTIEQMVDARRQQQSVLTVQPLLVGGSTPRLAVASNPMNEIFDASFPLAL
jgi:hypothetical protein